jgi:hypothetical protein
MPETPNRIRREQLFNKLVNNLQVLADSHEIKVEPESPDAIVCPTCFVIFPREALDVPQALTIEHVPPDFAGGIRADTVLLCGKCNHTFGHQLDSQLQIMLDTNDFLEQIPGAAIEGKYAFGDVPQMVATIRVPDNNTMHIHPDPKRANPKHVEKQIEIFEHTTDPTDLTGRFSFSLGKRHLADVALLRIAYLIAFRVLGYGYIFQRNLTPVREQIKNPTADILPKKWVLPSNLISGISPGIYRVTEPEYLRCLLVSFNLNSKLRTTNHVVLLPNVRQPGLGVYQWLDDQKEAVKITFKATEILESPEYLTEPELVLVSRRF